MCISYLGIPKEDEMSGIGYKVVRKNDDGTYSPLYAYASKDGLGCAFEPFDKRNYFKNRMVYRIGKPYVVRHKRIALTTLDNNNREYLAGVHLYAKYKTSLWEFQKGEYVVPFRLAIIKCKYEKALAIDRYYNIIVAKKITPIEEIMDSKKEM